MSEDNPRIEASAVMQRLLADAFTGSREPATKEDVAHLYSIIVHLRDIVMTQAGIIATMPLTKEQSSHFNEGEMPLNAFQDAIGDGVVKLFSSGKDNSDG